MALLSGRPASGQIASSDISWTLPLLSFLLHRRNFPRGVFAQPPPAAPPPFQRLVVLKVDGLNADLLAKTMLQQDEASGKSKLPWFSHVFAQNGVVFQNFYVRGISLSAPSWSILDTGQHAVIRGNVEYDRFTGQVYDYLNVFPFYIGYAQKRAVDMPGVEVLDRAGIPLLSDSFDRPRTLQTFQLFQRGVRWTTLKNALLRSVSGESLTSVLEAGTPISVRSSLSREVESFVERGLRGPDSLYFDFFTGEADHEGHATNNPDALFHVLRELDSLVGRIWTAIETGPLARQTLLVVVSDQGMNNVPGVTSQTFSLPDVFNRSEGGAHHVVTDREQLSDYKLKGINPLVHRVVTPSSVSFYLRGEASSYPTAWLDIDGNERAAVDLRNSDLNEIHILLQQLARADLNPAVRKAAACTLRHTIDRRRERWSLTVSAMHEELAALRQAIDERKQQLRKSTYVTPAEGGARDPGEDAKARLRLRRELQEWETEHADYSSYIARLAALLAFDPDPNSRFTGDIKNLLPEMSMGDNNSLHNLQNYVVGLSSAGLVTRDDGQLDEARSFRYVDYFSLLAAQHVQNNPQPQLSSKPVDFVAAALPEGSFDPAHHSPQRAYLLYGSPESQLVLLQDAAGQLMSLRPVKNLVADASAQVRWTGQSWRAGFPLKLFEDPELTLPAGQDRASWLSAWHTEREWFSAIHLCRYSNGVIGLTEELSPLGGYVPGSPRLAPALHRYEQRRRELTQADFHVFASDHWNFNVRFPNPGGNHGSFLRISTHSVWMMAGAGLSAATLEQPVDSLNFASTILNLLGRTPPMPGRVIECLP